MDREKMAAGVRAFLDALEVELRPEDAGATPERVARAWADDLLAGYATDPGEILTWTDAPEGTGLVLLRDVRFTSVCVHHLLPFTGFAHIAYLPGRRLAGLSKIGRVLDAHARRLQIQERLTADVLATITDVLQPVGALVVLNAEHTCMTLRGSRKEGSSMVTVKAGGSFESDPDSRREVLSIIAGGSAPRTDGG